jgi:hypothetical protein
MKVNHHINTINSGEWRRCRDVTRRDGMLECTLAPDQKYNLTAAYRSDLHIRFANARTDHELIAFVRAWGPLYLPNSQVPQDGVVLLPLRRCRTYQRWLKAFLNLLSAFKWAENEREALLEFLEAEDERYEGESASLMLLKNAFHVTEPTADWVNGADLQMVRAATNYLVPIAPVHPLLVNLTCRRGGNRRYVAADWTFLNLEEALRWMVWYDEFTQHPIVCCKDCRTVFRVDSGHARKYCTPECAHRATARMWQRKYNECKRRAQSTRRK